MSKTQIIGWIATGATVGVLLAVLSLTDLRAALDSGEALPGLYHVVLCWPILLALIPWNPPHALFIGMIYFLNACTFAFLLLIIGSIIHSFSNRKSANAGGTQ
jgi:hypothetical protein